MRAAQKEIVSYYRSDIIELLRNYSDNAALWLRNKGYLSRDAEDLVRSEKTSLAKATCILDHLMVADNGWLGLTEYLQEHSGEQWARTLHSALTNSKGHALDSVKSVASMPAWLDILQNTLKLFYNSGFSYVELFPNHPASAVPLEKIWVNLGMSAYNEERSYDNYLQPLCEAFQSGLPIIVKGEPGIGKTTLVQKICFDWANGKLPQFDLVFCGKLRHVTQADTLLDIALNWTLSRCPGISFGALKTDPEISRRKLLVVLDGFDESICNCEQIDRLLQSRESFWLPHSLIITTRPYKLYEIACPHRLLTITGFSLSQQLQFVENYCKLEKREAVSVQEKIKSTTSLSSLWRIPLFIYFICTAKDVESFDGSVTKLFFSLCESLITRYQQVTQASAKLTNWKRSRWIANVGALALYGLRDVAHGKLCFDDADLARFSIDSTHIAYSIGFLNKEEVVAGSSRTVSVSFPHKMFQEFFAALALSNGKPAVLGSLPLKFLLRKQKNMQGEFFKLLTDDTHKRLEMRQVLIFLAGMEGDPATLFNFFRSVSYNVAGMWDDDFLFFEQVERECPDRKLGADLVRALLCHWRAKNVTLWLDWQMFVSLYNAHFRAQGAPTIPDRLQGTAKLLFFDLHLTVCVSHIFKTSGKNSAADHLSHDTHQLECAWFTGTVQYLPECAEILQKSHVSLKRLRVTLEPGGMDNSVAWPVIDTLKFVYVDNTECMSTDLVPPAVQSLLQVQPAIEVLSFVCAQNQNVSSLDIHCWPNSTTSLRFENVNFDAALAKQLCGAIEKLHINCLRIHKASMRLEAFVYICQTLTKQKHIQELELGSLRIDGVQRAEVCRTFCECLKEMASLRDLWIQDCGLTDAVVQSLLDSLQTLKDLEKVDLGRNPTSQAIKEKLHKHSQWPFELEF